VCAVAATAAALYHPGDAAWLWAAVGAYGNAALTATSVAAAFWFVRRAAQGDGAALLAVVGLCLLAAAHAMLPVSAFTGLVPDDLILPVGRMLRAAAAALLLPYMAVELWRCGRGGCARGLEYAPVRW